MERITTDKDCLIVLMVYNPPKRYDKPKQISRENNDDTSKLVKEAVRPAPFWQESPHNGWLKLQGNRMIILDPTPRKSNVEGDIFRKCSGKLPLSTQKS